MLHYFPKFFTNKAIALYFTALIAITVIFFRNRMSMLWMVFGVVQVVGFFYFSNILTRRWSRLPTKAYQKRLIYTSVGLRLGWVVFSYFFYSAMTGKPFEFEAGDSIGYHQYAIIGAQNFRQGNFNIPVIFSWLGISDMGYSAYLSLIYLLSGNSILVARFLKIVWSVWTVLLIYKLSVRNFGEETGRMAGIFTMLMPNLILYCGLHLKEVEMVFLSVAFIERADYLIRSKRFNFKNMFLPLILAVILFTFRTVLGATALFALITALLFSTEKILGFGQRFIIGLWVMIAVAFFLGGRIATEVEQVWAERMTNQSQSMEWRAQREGGNIYADRANVALFAPAILIIPVPSMVDIANQQNQQLIHGGNYVKDILAFFLVFSIILIIRNNKWRDFTLLEAFFVGYLIVIAFSAFAQSERFHQPILPFYLMFAAYGVSQVTNKSKKYFNWYMVGLFFVILAWNFIKLSGRGIV